MGLFDYVEVQCKLPTKIEFGKNHAFQTKSFYQPCMSTYIITKKGSLLRKTWVKTGKNHKLYGSTIPEMKSGKNIKINYTGDIQFYTIYDTELDWKRGCWFAFKATFKGGKLQKLKKVVDKKLERLQK